MAFSDHSTVAQDYYTHSGVTDKYRRMGRKSSGGGEHFSKQETWRLIRLLVCAALFVSLVGAKINLPQQFQIIRTAVSCYLYDSIDYKEAFSAVGRAITGKETPADSAGDIYRAVFGPTGQEKEGRAAETTATVTSQTDRQELRLLPAFLQIPIRSVNELVAQHAALEANSIALIAEDGAAATAAAVITDSEDAPENVCMEQRILGISYTTPVPGRLSSEFGYREHPIEGEEKFHYGIDIAAAEGTPIGAFADGTVKAVGRSSSLGNYVILQHESNITTLYAHCSDCCVSTGATVKKGQTIAKVGQTGLATGAHCHFQIQQSEVYLNPIYYVTLL